MVDMNKRDHPWGGIGPDGLHWQRVPDVVHRGWRYTIELGPRPLATDRFDRDPIPDGTVGRITKALQEARDYSTEYAREGLRQIADEFNAADNIGEFDEALSELYDWGDRTRVIIKWSKE